MQLLQGKSYSELNKLKNEKLQNICKEYGRPYSGKKKADLIKEVHKGPADEGITEQERMLKYTLILPLPDTDRAAHRLGSLNEDNVCGVIGNLIHDEYDSFQFVDLWETGFFLSIDNKWLGASLDGWLVMKRIIESFHSPSNDDEEEEEEPYMPKEE